MKLIKLFLLLIMATTTLIACDGSEDAERKFGIFTVLPDNQTVEMDGTINGDTLHNFLALDAAYPNIKQINIKECDGSLDDEVNLKVAKKIHQKGINTHLMDNGYIASGGVDLFLSGNRRSIGENTKIGVHAWAGEDATATDFPTGHEYHQPYIDFYTSAGFTPQQAEEFYYFTINAAPAEGIHWMTDKEIEQYHITTKLL